MGGSLNRGQLTDDINSDLPVILDKEISNEEQDAFGHKDLVRALRSLIESSRFEAPYTIGLLGGWGTGKSTIRDMYVSTQTEADKARHKPIVFNAWRFGGEDIKRALLRHIFLDLGGNDEDVRSKLFSWYKRPEAETKSKEEIKQETRDIWLYPPLQVVAVFVPALLALWLVFMMFAPFSNTWANIAAMVVGTAIVASAAASIRYLLNPQRFIIPRHTNITRIALPSSTAEEYEMLFREQLTRFVDSKEGKNCQQLVVFVDDLDRLTAEEMVNALDAIRSFMDMKLSNTNSGLELPRMVFVVSCDEERVAHALADRRRQFKNPEAPGAVFSLDDARRFLDRIFQFRIDIAPFPKRDLRSYARKHFEEGNLKPVADSLERYEAPLDDVLERLVHVSVTDPRDAVHILNSFSQSWWLAVRREREGPGTDRFGGLAQGAVTDHPQTLAAISALEISFPDFHADLLRQPALLKAFLDTVFRGVAITSHRADIEATLYKYLETPENHDDPVKVKPGFRKLRRYVASLQGLRLPPNMEPLVLLNQDPLSRRRGDMGRQVLEALATGESQSVLEALGRQHEADETPFTEDDMVLLRGAMEDTEDETLVRKNNAAAALAEVSGRFPEASAHQLLSPVAKRLAASNELRWRLGVPIMGRLAGRLEEADRQDLAVALIDDLLRSREAIRFRTSGGETLSLNQAIETVQQAMSIILDVRSGEGLPEEPDRTLLHWLPIRRVASEDDREDHLPFEVFEEWVSEHQEHLLEDLGSAYTKVVTEKTSNETIAEQQVSGVVTKSELVFDQLQQQTGQESKELLWAHLARYISAQQEELVTLARQFAATHHPDATPDQVDEFLRQFASRLINEWNDEDEEWTLHRSAAGTSLTQLVEARIGDLSPEDTYSVISELAGLWSQARPHDGGVSPLAVRLLEALRSENAAEADELIEDWGQRVLGSMKHPCREWLARNYADLSEGQQQTIVTALDEIHEQPAEVDDKTISDYEVFINALSSEGKESQSIQSHLAQLLVQLNTQHQNEAYVGGVFPIIAPLIPHVDDDQVAQTLNSLFTNTQSTPSLFAKLHKAMVRHWPTTERIEYNAAQILEQSATHATNRAGDEGAPDILESIDSMLETGAVDEDGAATVIETASILWRQHHDRSLEVIRRHDIPPSSETTVQMAQEVDLDNPELLESLSSAWSHIAQQMDEGQRREAMVALLRSSPAQPPAEPDRAIRLWSDASPDQAVLLETLLTEQEDADGHLKRLWLQALGKAEVLGLDFFVRSIPRVLQRSEVTETRRAILEYRDTISGLVGEDRTSADELGKALLTALATLDEDTATQRALAQWMRDIGAKGTLRVLGTQVNPSEPGVRILQEYFESSAHLQSYAQDLRRE